MSRLKVYAIVWVAFWVVLIVGVLLAAGAGAVEPVPAAPELVAPPTCAFYANVVKFIEPSKDLWERPFGPAGTKEAFYGCMLSLWEVDELGNQLGGVTVFGLVPSAPGGGGTKLVTIPPQFTGKMVKANGFCVNGYGFGVTSVPVSYFVKGK